MADEDFEYFLTKLPLSIPGPACTDEHVRVYTSLVPDCLISYWQEFGFSGFGNGTAWLVDPIEWKVTTEEVLLDVINHPRLGEDAKYIPFARSAFGKVWFWTPGYGISVIVDPVRGTMFFRQPARDSSVSGLEGTMKAFFGASDGERFDFLDNSEQPMFDRVYEHLGALRFDELYGFAPGLRIGGAAIVEATHLFQIHVHMALLRSVIGDAWYVAG
ncbi:GAD-like domain-containing protein [Mycobacteroides abscessus]|uniref:GAD-like domain-containing protein n=1 Tax=Mycobacteroides abscessus TaxID=36809 RepID=UPI0002585B96|nr:GAD-like domain-containing protein [Mycobacteroides abscessus]EIC63620.1 GAD-like domain-containing protein [Mycobacteroides abscessus M93]